MTELLKHLGFDGTATKLDDDTYHVHLKTNKNGRIQGNIEGLKKKLKISSLIYCNTTYSVLSETSLSIEGMPGCSDGIYHDALKLLYVFPYVTADSRSWYDPVQRRKRGYICRYPDREIDKITYLRISGHFKNLCRFLPDDGSYKIIENFAGVQFVNFKPPDDKELVPFCFQNLKVIDLTDCTNPKLQIRWAFFANPSLETLMLPKSINLHFYYLDAPDAWFKETVEIVNSENIIYERDDGCCSIF